MSDTKICPFCGEEILSTAKKCKYCGEWLEPLQNKKSTLLNNRKNTNSGIGCAQILVILIFLLYIISNLLPLKNSDLNNTLSRSEDNYTASNEITISGITGDANFHGFGRCNNKKVGDILVRKYIEAINNAQELHTNHISLYALRNQYPNLNFSLVNPRDYDGIYGPECTCNIKFNNISENTLMEWSPEFQSYRLYYKDSICYIGYRVEEMDGKYRVRLNSGATESVSCKSIAGFE